MRTILLGIDAFDPNIFEGMVASGKLPNLAPYLTGSKYARFTVTNPPQSEVSWTSIATGMDPGGHGIFDFVHRDPSHYSLYVSLLPTQQGRFGTQFLRPYSVDTIFDYATQQGYPATALWWPAMFPAKPESPVRSIPGLGTPDIQGRLGVGTLFASDKDVASTVRKTAFAPLSQLGKGRYSAALQGPLLSAGKDARTASLNFELEQVDEQHIRLKIGRQVVELTLGDFSPILHLTFPVGFLARAHAITRVILTQLQPEVRLYFLPLQLHPLKSQWRYATPQSFVSRLWKSHGPFLTLGWPQDTTGLEEGCINEAQFLQLCDSIFATRAEIFLSQLHNFSEGLLGGVFDTLDRIQHMFWRDRPDIVAHWYKKMDTLVGKVQEVRASKKDPDRLLIVSDHGFSSFEHKVHLNRWLEEHGYLKRTEVDNVEPANLRKVDWSSSQAYAIGLNSLYLNLAGREGEGVVQPQQVEELLTRLQQELSAWCGPDGRPVMTQVWRRAQLFSGPYAPYSPDLILGYSPGYRGSAETGLGQWQQASITPNQDQWGADHCIAANAVPGVLFADSDLDNFPTPSFRDIPALAIDAELKASGAVVHQPMGRMSDEDDERIEERLKGLGYL